MNKQQLNLSWPAAGTLMLSLIALGAIGSYVLMRNTNRPPQTATGEQSPPHTAAQATAAAIVLTPDAIKRAGIVVSPVGEGSSSRTALRLPASIEANGYKQVTVTPLVAGRLTSVSAELGAHVRQGQTLASVFSPELAEAQTQYVSARAMLDAHERELARTETLVQIGAASRQELERLHAEHQSQVRSVESARARLELLGVSGQSIEQLARGGKPDNEAVIPSPLSGVVTERLANVGLNVDSATKLFTVVDLSTVWVVAELYEQDLSRVRVGDAATVTTAAYADRQIPGRVAYIDPQVNPATRTAKLRIEVANTGNELRLGMLAQATVEAAGSSQGLMVPRAALQRVAGRTVVYVTQGASGGEFIEREVVAGPESADQVEVLKGLNRGDRVVTEGSFFLRAERERRGTDRP